MREFFYIHMLKNPRFWSKRSLFNFLLLPVSWVWTAIGKWGARRAQPERVDIPVICVGNIVIGGAGKTPTVLALVEILKKMGHVPHILSRGYGAYIRDVIGVDPSKHTYLQVGDEPLLLAREAPTWAGPNRVLSAKTAIAHGATVIVMDDGLQNFSLHKDLSFFVLNAAQGLENGLVIPAGPLREPLSHCTKRVQAIIVIGENNPSPDLSLRVFHAKVNVLKNISYKKVIAFCGLGYPEKFKQTLHEQGYDIIQFIVFADHHPYTIPDMLYLTKLKKDHDAILLTTSKDWLRIPQAYRTLVEVLPIAFEFHEEDALRLFIEAHIGPVKTGKKPTPLEQIHP